MFTRSVFQPVILQRKRSVNGHNGLQIHPVYYSHSYHSHNAKEERAEKLCFKKLIVNTPKYIFDLNYENQTLTPCLFEQNVNNVSSTRREKLQRKQSYCNRGKFGLGR